MGNRRARGIGAAAVATVVVLLGSGCSSTGDTPGAAASSARPAGVADDKVVTAQALCSALLVAADLPPGYANTPTTPCDDKPDMQIVGFKGLKGDRSIEMVAEYLVVEKNAAELKTRMADHFLEEFKLTFGGPNAREQDPGPMRGLGEEVHYFTAVSGARTQSSIYVRRGKLLVFLGVNKDGAFTAEDMQQLASKAGGRAESLG